MKPSPKIRSRTRPPVTGVTGGSTDPVQKNHERKQNKENNKITTPAVKVSSIDLETKGINVLCKETEKKNTEKTQKSTVPPVPKLRKSKAKTENDSRISSEQQEAEKVRIRKKKASPDPKVSISI